MNTLVIIIVTILVYQVFVTIIYFISGEEENVLAVFGLGVCLLVAKTAATVKRYFGRRNIVTLLTDEEEERLYYCPHGEANSYLEDSYQFPTNLNKDELSPLIPKDLKPFGKVNLRYIPLRVAKRLRAKKIK